jgi:hypothetical protein
MLDHDTNRPFVGLSTQINRSFGQLWSRYAGIAPSAVRTELRGDIVTCVMVDAVEAFEMQTTGSLERQTTASPDGMDHSDIDQSLAGYKVEAVETITRLTRQRVSAFLSSHDLETDVATEIFELEPSPRFRGPPTNRHDARLRAETAPPPRTAGR